MVLALEYSTFIFQIQFGQFIVHSSLIFPTSFNASISRAVTCHVNLWYEGARHEVQLIVCVHVGTVREIILSKEGTIQGCACGAVLYGIGLMPLVDDLHEANSEVLQLWYTGDLSFQGKSSKVAILFKRLEAKGPSVGYFPELANPKAVEPNK